ncbi:CPXCG motif-containing cysteine-rich protein [Hahella sp. KA22]|uniref:CPXCG motif-containing cysteine-rich protein n=1 Tax=Hahella sp. KA22 TaxID=1628392 RepID=UPI001F4EF136|nr:CPXCG motif-containing cysteine-rich protein [Hahella sp. KA22]
MIYHLNTYLYLPEKVEMLRYCEVSCPYCGETQTVAVDCSTEIQDYYEDCRICCRPMSMHVTCSYEGEVLDLCVRSEDEA